MNKKFMFVICMVFITMATMPLISSEKVQVFEAQTRGLTIEFQKYDYTKVGENFEVHTHVFNNTDGLPLTNETVDCFLHFYYPNGSHALKTEMDFNPPFDWEYLIQGEAFVDGKGSWIIQCNSSTDGGFSAGKVTLNHDGLPPKQAGVIIFFSMLFIAIVITMLSMLFNTIFRMIAWDFDAKDLIFNISGYFGIFVTYILSKHYLESDFINEFLVWFIGIGSFTMVILPLIAFFLSIVKGNLKKNE